MRHKYGGRMKSKFVIFLVLAMGLQAQAFARSIYFTGEKGKNYKIITRETYGTMYKTWVWQSQNSRGTVRCQSTKNLSPIALKGATYVPHRSVAWLTGVAYTYVAITGSTKGITTNTPSGEEVIGAGPSFVDRTESKFDRSWPFLSHLRELHCAFVRPYKKGDRAPLIVPTMREITYTLEGAAEVR